MTRRGLRFGLVLLFLGVLGAGGSYAWRSQQTTEEHRKLAQAFDTSVHLLLSTLGDTRGALLSFLAAGQEPSPLEASFVDALVALRSQLGVLRQLTSAASTLNDVDAAAAAIDELEGIRNQVGALIESNELEAAGALIFRRGLASLDFARERVTTAWQSEQARWATQEHVHTQRLTSLATGGGALAVLVVALLLPTGWLRPADVGTLVGLTPDHAHPAAADASVTSDTAAAAGVGETAAAAAPPITDTRVDAGQEAAASRPEPATPAVEDGSPRDRRKSVELTAAAELCTDFGRIREASELPALLDRAADLIDARGLIVWVADANDEELRPALSQGYPPQTVARLPAIPREADNATAAAWRDAEVRIVRTNGMTSGALAVPLLTSRGSVGVLSAEVRHGREASAMVNALTRLVASQIATLVTAPAAEAPRESASLAEEAQG